MAIELTEEQVEFFCLYGYREWQEREQDRLKKEQYERDFAIQLPIAAAKFKENLKKQQMPHDSGERK